MDIHSLNDSFNDIDFRPTLRRLDPGKNAYRSYPLQFAHKVLSLWVRKRRKHTLRDHDGHALLLRVAIGRPSRPEFLDALQRNQGRI